MNFDNLIVPESKSFKLDDSITLDERELQIPLNLSEVGVTNDNKVERLNFKVPAVFDGVNDLSTFSWWVNYVNAAGQENLYHVDDLKKEGDYLTFSWLTNENLYAESGDAHFALRAVHEDGRAFGTKIATLRVAKGLNTASTIYEHDYDFINQYFTELNGMKKEVNDAVALLDGIKKDAEDVKVSALEVEKNRQEIETLVKNPITPEKVSFVKKVFSKNLHNELNDIVGKWYVLSSSTNKVVLQENQYTAKYTAIKIKVKGNQKISFSNSNNNIYSYFFVDNQDQFISGEKVYNEKMVKITLQIPEKAEYLLVSATNVLGTNKELMINYGEPLPYEPYYEKYVLDGVDVPKEKDKLNNITLKLPKSYFLVVGDTFELFYKGIVNAVYPENYYVECNCNKGNTFTKKFVFIPKREDVGIHTLTLSLYNNNHDLLDTKQVDLVVNNKPVSPTSRKNILFVADSLGVSRDIHTEFKRRLIGTGGIPIADNLSNINVMEQEANGGWAYWNYNNESFRNHILYITCESHDKTQDDQHSKYVDSAGHKWKLETIEDGRIKIIGDYANTLLPSKSGTLTWVSGGVNHNDIVFTNYAYAPGNPFWDESAKKIDFKKYAEKVGVTSIDYIYILLGWNFAGASKEEIKKDAQIFIDNVHESFPNCEICLLGLEIPARDGLGSNYVPNELLSKYYEAMQSVWKVDECNVELSANNLNVHCFNTSGQFDTENNMSCSTRPVNVRNSKTEIYQTNGVHPAQPGSYQIADAMYRDFVNELSKLEKVA